MSLDELACALLNAAIPETVATTGAMAIDGTDIVECGTDSTAVQIVGSRLLGREGTRGTSAASSGTTCLHQLPTHARCIRAGRPVAGLGDGITMLVGGIRPGRLCSEDAGRDTTG